MKDFCEERIKNHNANLIPVLTLKKREKVILQRAFQKHDYTGHISHQEEIKIVVDCESKKNTKLQEESKVL
jgi:hypothetical protein